MSDEKEKFWLKVVCEDKEFLAEVDTMSTDDFGNLFVFIDGKTLAGYNSKYWKYFKTD